MNLFSTLRCTRAVKDEALASSPTKRSRSERKSGKENKVLFDLTELLLFLKQIIF